MSLQIEFESVLISKDLYGHTQTIYWTCVSNFNLLNFLCTHWS